MEQGALDLETIEANPVVEGDLVKDLVVQKKNLARTIIEELMVAANGAMVNYLGKAGIPMIQRVVLYSQVLGRDCPCCRILWSTPAGGSGFKGALGVPEPPEGDRSGAFS